MMEQVQNQNGLTDAQNHLKDRKSNRVGTKKSTFLFLQLIIAFISLFICGCNKDDDSTNIDDLESIEIKEIVCCQSDLNDANMQAKFAVKTANKIIITYEYTGVKKGSTSCMFYYDGIERQGRCMVFSQNKMTQYLVSSQNEFDKYVFEAEILDSLICFREFEYDWNNGKTTVLGEYYFEKSEEYTQLKSGETEQMILDFVKKTLGKIRTVFISAGKTNEAIGDTRGKMNGQAFKNASETIERAENIISDASKNDDSFWTRPVNETITEGWRNVKITITNKKDEYWEKIEPFLTEMKDGAINTCKELYELHLEKAGMKIKESLNRLTLSTYEMYFSKEGGNGSFTINTNLSVANISSTKSWCEISYSHNVPELVSVAVSNNKTGKTRIATIFVDAIDENTKEKRSKAILISQDNKEANILGEWSCNTSGPPENSAFPISLNENRIAIVNGITGTWSLNGNNITIKFAAQDNVSYTLNGIINGDKTKITGNYIDVWAWYDDDTGNFSYNETFNGTFVMSKIEGTGNGSLIKATSYSGNKRNIFTIIK